MKAAALVLGLCGVANAAAVEPAAPLFALPGQPPFALGVEISVGGKSPEEGWEKFLSEWFNWFDRDQNGTLSQEEAALLGPLPMADKKELRIAGDGGLTAADFLAYCRKSGAVAVIGAVEAPAASDLRLSALFRQRLDTDRDGQFSAGELKRIAVALRAFDFNEDEYLELKELLDNAPAAGQPEPAGTLAGAAAEAMATLRVHLGGESPGVELLPPDALALLGGGSAGGRSRFRGPEGRWLLVVEPRRSLPAVQSAGEFLSAQLVGALRDKADLPIAEIKQDPVLSGLTELAAAGDRSGNQRLSTAELLDYTALIASGVQAQIGVTLTDREHNFFPALDADADGRLSYQELARGGMLLAAGKAGELPRQFELSFGAGPARAFGGMVIPKPAPRKPPAPVRDNSPSPQWFIVTDRNGDGALSPREFLGPPDLFRRLDADGDGAISLAEAIASPRSGN